MTDAGPDVRFWRDPDLPGIELRYSCYDQSCFGEHAHDTYSIGIIEGGTTRAVLRGVPVSPKTGQVVLIHPDEIHLCNPVEGSGWAYRMLFVTPECLAALGAELTGSEAAAPQLLCSVVDDDEVFQAIKEAAQSIESGADALEKQSAVTHALSLVLTRYGDVALESGGDEREAVRRAKGLLEDRLAENISLETLAAQCGLSRYHLLREFKRSVGMPPHSWRTQKRIQLARRLIADGMPLAEVALETGFTDQSHFSTTFKKIVGTTPTTYQRG